MFRLGWPGRRDGAAVRLSILAILPLQKGQVTGLTGLLAAIKPVFTVYGGHTAANGTPVLTGRARRLAR